MNSYINIICFFFTTIFYFFALKPKITINILSSDTLIKNYTKSNLLGIAIYFLLVIIVQFGLNTYIITSNCGGSVSSNLKTSALMTFIPWFFIFGFMMAILILFPGFKSAFSDVIGYFYVAGSAKNLLDELLVNAEIYKDIENSAQGNRSKLEALKSTASLVTKLTGNMSLLINKIVPANFMKFWDLLKPLMKEQYHNGENAISMRNKLLELSSTRENIGEGMWYIYTGIILISIVQFSITSKGCVSDLATMQKNYKNFQEQEDTAIALDASANATNTLYTLTN